MIVQNNAYPEFQYVPESGWGALYFHRWLMKHPKLSKFNDTVESILSYSIGGNLRDLAGWNELFKGLKIMQIAHESDARKSDSKPPYIIHQFEIISDYIHENAIDDIRLYDILIFFLHDVVEDHPQYWKEILEQFGPITLRDVLILSTGGIDRHIRQEILDFLSTSELYCSSFLNSKPGDIMNDIGCILDPMPPLRKLYKESIYSQDNFSHEASAIKRAIEYYSIVLLGIMPEEEKFEHNDEYIALGNYLYMNRFDIRRKLGDMLNNMKDMEQMEEKAPGYIAKRHIKAYILIIKMNNLGMVSEKAKLLGAFTDAGHPLNQAQLEQKMSAKLDTTTSI